MLPMKMIDARQNQRAAQAVRWARVVLGERRRNWTKPITQVELADLLEGEIKVRPHQSMISRYMTGNSFVPTDVLSGLARLIGKRLGRALTIDDLLDLAERDSRLSYVHRLAA